jgi:hypothetical protein
MINLPSTVAQQSWSDLVHQQKVRPAGIVRSSTLRFACVG